MVGDQPGQTISEIPSVIWVCGAHLSSQIRGGIGKRVVVQGQPWTKTRVLPGTQSISEIEPVSQLEWMPEKNCHPVPFSGLKHSSLQSLRVLTTSWVPLFRCAQGSWDHSEGVQCIRWLSHLTACSHWGEVGNTHPVTELFPCPNSGHLWRVFGALEVPVDQDLLRPLCDWHCIPSLPVPCLLPSQVWSLGAHLEH
jgi:hypothetical protein